MNKWYLCTVAYERQGDEMGLRKVSESYLVDALTFTEAEERIIKEVTPFVSCGVLEVVNIRPMRLADMLISNNGSNYYRGKVVGSTQAQIDWVRSHRPEDPSLESARAKAAPTASDRGSRHTVKGALR